MKFCGLCKAEELPLLGSGSLLGHGHVAPGEQLVKEETLVAEGMAIRAEVAATATLASNASCGSIMAFPAPSAIRCEQSQCHHRSARLHGRHPRLFPLFSLPS